MLSNDKKITLFAEEIISPNTVRSSFPTIPHQIFTLAFSWNKIAALPPIPSNIQALVPESACLLAALAEFKFYRRQKHQSLLFWRSMHIFSCLPLKMHMQIREVSTHSSSISRDVLLADTVRCSFRDRTLLNVVGREIERKTGVRRRRQLLMTWYNLHTTLCKID